MMATKALITKANGLAKPVALFPGTGEAEALLSEPPDVPAAVPAAVVVTAMEVVTVLVLDKVA